jgi:hypothetical protein
MNEYIDQRGFLTDTGRKIFEARFGREVDALLSMATDENQTRIIGSLLSWMVGNKASNKAISFRSSKDVK